MVGLPKSPATANPPSYEDDQFSLHDVSSVQVQDNVVMEKRKGDNLGFLVALGGVAVFVIGTWLIVLTNDPKSLGMFAFHPTLQSLAIGLFAVGILTLQPTNQPKTKAAGLKRHQIIMLGLGLPTIFVGTLLIFWNKIIHEHGHFTTWHATFGGIAFVWMIVQILLGGLSVWFGGAAFGGGMKAKKVWRYHRASGYLLFPMFLLTAVVGGNYSNWSAGHASVGVRILIFTLAPIALLAGLWSRIRLSKMNFRQ